MSSSSGGGLQPSGVEGLARILKDAPPSGRIRAAWIVAILADALEVVFPLFFAEGIISPLNDILDVVVAITMVVLLGWHWAFLPSFISKLVPIWDIIPTWTAAVFFATTGHRKSEPTPKAETPQPSVEQERREQS